MKVKTVSTDFVPLKLELIIESRQEAERLIDTLKKDCKHLDEYQLIINEIIAGLNR